SILVFYKDGLVLDSVEENYLASCCEDCLSTSQRKAFRNHVERQKLINPFLRAQQLRSFQKVLHEDDDEYAELAEVNQVAADEAYQVFYDMMLHKVKMDEVCLWWVYRNKMNAPEVHKVHKVHRQFELWSDMSAWTQEEPDSALFLFHALSLPNS